MSPKEKDDVLGRDSEASIKDIQADLQALREDLNRLAEEVGNAFSSKGAAAWRAAKANLRDTLSDVDSKREEAADAVRSATEALNEFVEDAVTSRPLPALALAAVVGFICGAVWRR